MTWMTLYLVACAAVVVPLVLAAVEKVYLSERRMRALFAAFYLLILVGSIALTSLLLLPASREAGGAPAS